jgi:hypothetical protein
MLTAMPQQWCLSNNGPSVPVFCCAAHTHLHLCNRRRLPGVFACNACLATLPSRPRFTCSADLLLPSQPQPTTPTLAAAAPAFAAAPKPTTSTTLAATSPATPQPTAATSLTPVPLPATTPQPPTATSGGSQHPNAPTSSAAAPSPAATAATSRPIASGTSGRPGTALLWLFHQCGRHCRRRHGGRAGPGRRLPHRGSRGAQAAAQEEGAPAAPTWRRPATTAGAGAAHCIGSTR